MKLKNYQEDIVLHVIDIMLEDNPEIEADETLISDVAAYVLNRIPAKYIMSERVEGEETIFPPLAGGIEGGGLIGIIL